MSYFKYFAKNMHTHILVSCKLRVKPLCFGLVSNHRFLSKLRNSIFNKTISQWWIFNGHIPISYLPFRTFGKLRKSACMPQLIIVFQKTFHCLWSINKVLIGFFSRLNRKTHFFNPFGLQHFLLIVFNKVYF